MLFGIRDQLLPALHGPFAPGRDDRDIGFERKIGELEPDLVVPLARGPVADCVSTLLDRDLDLALGDQRPRDGRAEQITALIDRVRPQHGEHKVPHELFAEIVDEYLARTGPDRLVAQRLELLALADISRECDHFRAVGLFEPGDDDRRIKPAGIGNNDLFYVLLQIINSHRGDNDRGVHFRDP